MWFIYTFVWLQTIFHSFKMIKTIQTEGWAILQKKKGGKHYKEKKKRER